MNEDRPKRGGRSGRDGCILYTLFGIPLLVLTFYSVSTIWFYLWWTGHEISDTSVFVATVSSLALGVAFTILTVRWIAKPSDDDEGGR